ncbi:MAG: hypothetical protein Tsb0015_04590 [Simkaniaceae bacterium]
MNKFWKLTADLSFLSPRGKKWLYALLGPGLIVLALGMACIQKWPIFTWFFLAYIVGFFVMTIWKARSAYLSFFTLGLLGLLHCIHYRDPLLFCITISCILNYYISFHFFNNLREIYKNEESLLRSSSAEKSKLQKDLEHLTEKFRQSESELQKTFLELQDKEDYADSLKKLAAKEKKEIESLLQEKEQLTSKCLQIQQQLHKVAIEADKSQKKLQELEKGNITQKQLNELNDLRTKHFQLQLLHNHLQKNSGQISKGEKLKSQSSKYLPIQEEKNQMQLKYEALQKECANLRLLVSHHQSDNIEEKLQEKIEELHATRIDLFKIESKLIVLAKENERMSLENPMQEKALCDYLQITDNECLRLEEENQLLHDIISHWSREKSVKI